MDWKFLNLFIRLGLMEVSSKYRRTAIGPLWIAVGFAIFVFGMGFIWSTIFGMATEKYFPYFSTGLITWYLISSAINQSGDVFLKERNSILNMNINPFGYIIKSSVSWVYNFSLQSIIVIAVMVIFNSPITANTFLFIPGMILLFFNLIWVSTLISLVATRYQDAQLIINSIMPLVFLITPVMWYPEMVEARAWLVDFNPFAHLINIVRMPLLDAVPPIQSYYCAMTSMFIGGGLSVVVWRQYANYLPFWL